MKKKENLTKKKSVVPLRKELDCKKLLQIRITQHRGVLNLKQIDPKAWVAN
jgi:hypothetical protein